MAPAASQFSGGRRVTTGATGEVSPSTNSRAKYCQPHRSGGEHAQNHRGTGTDNRRSMAPAASQFSGGRWVTTGATGEASNCSKTVGEEARGGERGMHARAKWL